MVPFEDRLRARPRPKKVVLAIPEVQVSIEKGGCLYESTKLSLLNFGTSPLGSSLVLNSCSKRYALLFVCLAGWLMSIIDAQLCFFFGSGNLGLY